MFEEPLFILLVTAASLGFIHTLLGPDHYIPFVAVSKARNWNIRKTAWITGICGLAHVGSSVIIGLAGLKLSYELGSLTAFESARGAITAWLIIAFGLVYMIWGLRKAFFPKKAAIIEKMSEGKSKAKMRGIRDMLPWALFIVFLFGPCEPLIPLLMFPAAEISILGMALVAGVFGLATVGTMLVMVLLPLYGIHWVRLPYLARYGHALAGFLILFCGMGIRFLGL